MFSNFSIFATILVVLLSNWIIAQDIGYPERAEEDVKKQNAENRKPVYVPGRCAENELLYPGDQDNDWICDCSPGFLFHPDTNRCYSAYRQGPCVQGSYLILPKKRAMPQCIENPCRQDGKVEVRNQCYDLGQKGPCPQPELHFVLGVNSTTLDIACIRLSVVLETRFGDSEANSADTLPNGYKIQDVPLCAKGCKRYINGTCPEDATENPNNVDKTITNLLG